VRRATAEAIGSRRHPLFDFSSILRDAANAREGGWSTDIARLHLRQNVQCADEKLAAQIADAPAPFWRHVGMRWPSGIGNPPQFRTSSLPFGAKRDGRKQTEPPGRRLSLRGGEDLPEGMLWLTPEPGGLVFHQLTLRYEGLGPQSEALSHLLGVFVRLRIRLPFSLMRKTSAFCC